MSIVIKEIQINTVIEKKVVQTTDISDCVYKKIKEEVVRYLSEQGQTGLPLNTGIKKNER